MDKKFIELPLPRAGQIHHVFHFADIHIRDGDINRSRYSEYLTVFRNLFASLKNHPAVREGRAVSVLVGDILDHKIKLGGAGCNLFNRFIRGLSECGPVYVVQGNHDFQQALPDEPSILEGLLINAPENVAYLDRTGLYAAGTVGFGLVLTRDTLVLGSGSGQRDTLPDFPNPSQFPAEVQTKLALFHGTITGCLLQNYNPSQEGFPKDWIKGYDAHLLGDVHLHQIHGAKLLPEDSKAERRNVWEWTSGDVWAYPGSLIQQTFGENAFSNHGYLDWSVIDRKVRVCHVPNPWAKIYLRCVNGDWLCAFPEKRWEPLSNALDAGRFKHVELRIRNRIRPQDSENLHAMLLDWVPMTYEITNGLLNNYVYDETEVTIIDGEVAGSENPEEDSLPQKARRDGMLSCEQYNSPETWVQYVTENQDSELMRSDTAWQDWLRNPSTLLVKEDEVDISNRDTVKTRNKKLQKLIEDLTCEIRTSATRTHLKLRYLQWSWLLCYGANNWMNFDELEQSICGANAPNSNGKSAFFDVVCLAVFGKLTPLRKGTDSLICNYKPTGQTARTSIIIDINGETYRISREFRRKVDSGSAQQVNQCLDLICTDATRTVARGAAVSRWIQTHIGDLNSFLLSSMITQEGDQDFFKISSQTQLDILDQALNLNAYNALMGLLREADLFYSALRKSHTNIHAKLQSQITQIDESEGTRLRKEQSEIADLVASAEIELEGLVVDPNLPRESLELPSALIQKYIQAHRERLPATEIEPIETAFTQQPHKIAREINDKLVTMREKWESMKAWSELQYDERQCTQAEKTYRVLNNGSIEVPGRSKDLLDHQKKIIEENKARWSGFDPSPDRYQSLLANINASSAQIEGLRDERARLVGELASAGELDETWEQWHARTAGSALTEQDFSDLSEWCRQHPLKKPVIELNDIESRETELRTELGAIPVTWRALDPEALDKVLVEEQEKRKLGESELRTARATIEECQKIVRPSELRPVSEPAMTESDCQAWIADYHTREALFPSQTAQHRALQEYMEHRWSIEARCQERLEELRKQLSEVQSLDHPYNPECWACQKQPWKIQLDKLQNEVSLAEEKLANAQEAVSAKLTTAASALNLDAGVLAKMDPRGIGSIVDQLAGAMQKLENELSAGSLKTHEEILAQWAKYRDYQTQHTEYLTRFEAWATAKDQIIALQGRIAEREASIREVESNITSVKMCISNHARWDRTRRECHEAREQWKTYEEERIKHERSELAKKVRNEAAIWEKRRRLTELEGVIKLKESELSTLKESEQEWNLYHVEKKKWEDLEEEWIAGCRVWEAWEAWDRLVKAGEATRYKKEMMAAQNRMQFIHWLRVAHNKNIADRRTELTERLEELRGRSEDVIGKIARWEQVKVQIEKQQEDVATMAVHVGVFEAKCIAIEHLKKLFTNFRLWLYKHKVLPRLTETANRIARLIIGENDHMPKRLLLAEVSHKSINDQKSMIIKWKTPLEAEMKANDAFCAQAPSISYGGGCEKAILGFALRIAISNIGASSILCRQLFIDEGFAAADEDNMSRVPRLIENLLDLYDSVIMVTHIQALKEVVTSNIIIHRDANLPLSEIRHGPALTGTIGHELAHSTATDSATEHSIHKQNSEPVIIEITPNPTTSPNAVADAVSTGSGVVADGAGVVADGIPANLLALADEISSKQNSDHQKDPESHNVSTNTKQGINSVVGMVTLQSDKCQAMTRTGNQCTFNKKEGDYCRKHGKIYNQAGTQIPEGLLECNVE